MSVERHDVPYAEGYHWRAFGTFSLLHFKLDPPAHTHGGGAPSGA